MQHSTSRQLYTYWAALCGNRLAPRRSDIEPGRLAPILGATFLLEGAFGGLFRFRLAGTLCCSQFGFDPAGHDFVSLWDNADRNTVVGVLKAITRGACALAEAAPSRPATHDTGEDGGPPRFELLLLPLIHTGSAIDRIIGSAAILSGERLRQGRTSAPFRLLHHGFVAQDRDSADRPESAGLRLHKHPAVRRARVVTAHGRRFRVYSGGLDPM